MGCRTSRCCVVVASLLGGCASGTPSATGSATAGAEASSGGSGSATGASASTGSGSSGSSSGGSSTGGPELVFDLDPIRLNADAGFYKQFAVSSLTGETVSSKIAFQDVPDSGTCQGVINGATSSGGRKFLLLCDANDAGYLLSLSADQAGTTVTIQSMLNDEGQIVCGSLYFGCASDADCCIGFGCQSIDAGPTTGEIHRCEYDWPG